MAHKLIKDGLYSVPLHVPYDFQLLPKVFCLWYTAMCMRQAMVRLSARYEDSLRVPALRCWPDDKGSTVEQTSHAAAIPYCSLSQC